jgi:hypothetical protein
MSIPTFDRLMERIDTRIAELKSELDAQRDKEKLIEEIAQIIYKYECGCNPDEYEQVFNVHKKPWGTPDRDGLSYQLSEHDRGDFRYQAKRVLEFLREKGLLK